MRDHHRRSKRLQRKAICLQTCATLCGPLLFSHSCLFTFSKLFTHPNRCYMLLCTPQTIFRYDHVLCRSPHKDSCLELPSSVWQITSSLQLHIHWSLTTNSLTHNSSKKHLISDQDPPRNINVCTQKLQPTGWPGGLMLPAEQCSRLQSSAQQSCPCWNPENKF